MPCALHPAGQFPTQRPTFMDRKNFFLGIACIAAAMFIFALSKPTAQPAHTPAAVATAEPAAVVSSAPVKSISSNPI